MQPLDIVFSRGVQRNKWKLNIGKSSECKASVDSGEKRCNGGFCGGVVIKRKVLYGVYQRRLSRRRYLCVRVCSAFYGATMASRLNVWSSMLLQAMILNDALG
jgi:hypothetical protein